MTKILYNRAAKTFMDAIGQGFDEQGAYAKVEKKHGKVLADAVWTEAQAEMKTMKKNPREEESAELKKYRLWVKQEGHVVASASSVLDSYIKEHKLGKELFIKLAKEMGFTDPEYGYSNNPRLEVSKIQKDTIRITPAQLGILVSTHRSKTGFWYTKSETQARAAANLELKGLFEWYGNTPDPNRKGYKLTSKGKSLLEKYLKSVHQLGK